MKIKTIFKNINLSKVFFASIFICFGALLALLTNSFAKDKKSDDFASLEKEIQEHQRKIFTRFNSDFFDDDIFEEMDLMQKKMDKAFELQRKKMREAFKNAKKENKNSDKISISTSENEDFYLYELQFSGFKKEDIIVEIKDNALTFYAQNKKVDKKSTATSENNFYYSFFLPEYNKSVQPEISREEAKIIVKIKKNLAKNDAKP